jgi:hypothetical protein
MLRRAEARREARGARRSICAAPQSAQCRACRNFIRRPVLGERGAHISFARHQQVGRAVRYRKTGAQGGASTSIPTEAGWRCWLSMIPPVSQSA